MGRWEVKGYSEVFGIDLVEGRFWERVERYIGCVV